MSRRYTVAAVLSCMLALVPSTAPGQVVIETENGPLEIIGLDRWSVQALEDSIAHYAPGESIRSHACAAVLKDQLHFASAALQVKVAADGSRVTLLTVVEPHNAQKATRRTIDAPHRAPLWPALREAAAGAAGFDFTPLTQALQFYEVAEALGVDSAQAFLTPHLGRREAPRVFATLRAARSQDGPQDLEAALATLGGDGDRENRALAAAVLANFPESDAAWHALVAGLRDENPGVAAIAQHALNTLRATAPRRIDWRPAVSDLVPLLAGANAWAFADLLSTLVATEIDPALASNLLAGNWRLALSHARAQHAGARDPAAALLQRMSGLRDAGPDAWQAWAETLGQGR